MKLLKPDYSNSILNIPNSILKYFGAQTYHEGLSDLDALLEEKQYKHVVVMVNDGMGYENMVELLPEDSFLRRHFVRPITSIFPPTTAAATTTLQSGQSAMEHGWLGWDVYIPQVDDVVTVFLNRSKTSGDFFEENVAKKYLQYQNVYDKIPAETGIKAYGISPHEINPYDFNQPEQMYEMIEALCAKDERSYIYAYYDQPDNLMHRYGTQVEVVRERALYIDAQIEALSHKLKDTLLVVTADHGHIDVENLYLEDYPDLVEMLAKPTSMETRAVNFFVKENKKDAFASLFNDVLGAHFKLVDRDTFIQEAYLGDFDAHPNIEGAIGDFIAIATDRFTLLDDRNAPNFKGHHAGLTQREMLVPLILIDCK